MKKVLKWIGIFVGAILLVGIIFLIWLTAVEYKPADTEKVEVDSTYG